MSERARQFLAFDAVKGLKEALQEKEKIIVEKIDLSEDAQEELAYKINQVKTGTIIKITYFEKGEYIELTGMVTNIDPIYRTITIVKKKIPLDDIYQIKADYLKNLDDLHFIE